MIPFVPTPENTEDLDFRVLKFDYNQYQIFVDENPVKIKGILRVATVPYRILKVKQKTNEKPQFIMQSINVLSFLNQGQYGKPNSNPLAPNELNSIKRKDITEMLHVLIEPYNVYITINTKPNFAIRTKTTIIKAEVLIDRFDDYGNPMFLVELNTLLSYAIEKNPTL